MADTGADPAARPGMLTNLTKTEQALVDAASRGDERVCSRLETAELRCSVSPAHLVRARLLRELLLGWHGDIDPRGIRLTGARITGEFDMNHVKVDFGLHLNECVVDHDAQLRRAHLPWLTLKGCNLPALIADGLQLDGDLCLHGGFTATSAGENGTLSLIGAHISGKLDLEGAQLTNNNGPALIADGLRLEASLFLGCTANSKSEDDTLRLNGAHISGDLYLDGTQVTTNNGALVNLSNARCSSVYLPAAVVCPASRSAVRRVCPDSDRIFSLTGFTYTDFVKASWEQWLHLLRHHTRIYGPQPYQQLAAARTAAGHDRDTRRILIVQQQDHRARGVLGGPLRRALHATWGGLAGYGYRTGRLALALLAVLFLASGLGVWAGNTPTTNGQHAAQRPPQSTAQSPSGTPTTNAAPPPARCSLVELVGLGIDRGLPLGSTGVRTRCDLDTTSTEGQWFTATIWLLQAAVWALATLAIAGYTGLVRKIR